jgi:hypothetical protein
VDRTDDDATATACTSAPNDCSLRGAIIAANAHPGPDIINLPAGTYGLTLTGISEDAAATGDLDITDTSGELTLVGAGADTTIISANQIDRVFHVMGNVTATFSGMTITGGLADGYGGGVYNLGTLALSSCTLSNNSAQVNGGGLTNGGTATLTNCTLRNNSAQGGGGGIANWNTLTVGDSTLSGNVGSGGGGGIYNCGHGAVTVVNTTLNGNSTDYEGGAIAHCSNFPDSMLTLTNSTLTNNSAQEGGGITTGATLKLQNCTLSGNSATNGRSGGIYNSGPGTATLAMTILADSTGSNCETSSFGKTVSGDYNLDTDGSCGLSGAHDMSGLAANLAPLGNYGGSTQTHAPCTGKEQPDASCSARSPAIDAGDNSDCPTTDQRGLPRPADGNGDGVAVCDIGAYEAVFSVLDVDMNGHADVATDIVYIARCMLRLTPVPSSFRSIDPTIPSDALIGARINALLQPWPPCFTGA